MNFFLKLSTISLQLKKTKYKSKNQIENLSIFLDEKIKTINFNYNKLPKNLLNEAKKDYYRNQTILVFQLLKVINIEKKVGQFISLYHLLINL